uniref:HAT C-terminal dimerisation domain-containing protein n=1 Tax=Cajanus cajan TaxID=3821 RepID=A0A151TSS5_CAJCA|nr:hypothetical protein KK1_009317 [Cajanus cajan]
MMCLKYIVEEDDISLAQKGEACALLNSMETFKFVFTLHLMKNILGITHELSQALQRSDQDIINAMKLVSVSKQRLQAMRDDYPLVYLLLELTLILLVTTASVERTFSTMNIIKNQMRNHMGDE